MTSKIKMMTAIVRTDKIKCFNLLIKLPSIITESFLLISTDKVSSSFSLLKRIIMKISNCKNRATIKAGIGTL